jgi:hypothetical protein
VASIIKSLAYGGNVRAHTGRGLVVGGEHRLDHVGFVGLQDLSVTIGRQAMAPRRLNDLDLKPVALTHIDPAMREHAVARSEDLVARAQRVGQRRFPAACSG